MNIQLSDHFTYKKLLRFTFPSIVMLVFSSIYAVVDGFFVSNFVGKTPFAALNLIWPFIMILGAFGFMFGTGGSALIAKIMGEGDMDKANSLFSLFVYVSFVFGVVIAAVGIAVIRPVSVFLGAEGELLDNCIVYGRVLLLAIPAFMLQMEFQSFFITAEKPQLGLYVTVASGVTNMVLDALFVAVFRWGLVGAAAATGLSQFVGGVIPLMYFLRPNNSILRLKKPSFDGKALIKCCTNGSSELMTNLSMSLVNMLYNVQLLEYAGENGVAAYGVLMYVNFVFLSAFIGYSIGCAPVISYHFGAKNTDELKSLFKKSLVITGVFSVAMLVMGEMLAKPLSYIFVGYDETLFDITLRAFMIFSFSFLFAGFSVFGSSFFTALNNGVVSAAISFLRTLVFQVAAILVLPAIFELDGIWVSTVVAETMAVFITGIFFIKMNNKYNYI